MLLFRQELLWHIFHLSILCNSTFYYFAVTDFLQTLLDYWEWPSEGQFTFWKFFLSLQSYGTLSSGKFYVETCLALTSTSPWPIFFQTSQDYWEWRSDGLYFFEDFHFCCFRVIGFYLMKSNVINMLHALLLTINFISEWWPTSWF